jgi:4-amino-4-deoxy-L-arabinose transferase-like glycosyltransferase
MLTKKIWKNESFLIVLLMALCLTLFFFHLGARPFWDPDEGKHATTSKDMVLNGDWITPTFNGEPFYDKPILYNWLAALSFLVLGFTEFAARLPAAVLGSGCVIITYLLGKRMFNPAVGFLSAVILATSGEVIVLSRAVVHDISLVFFVTLALYLFYLAYKDNRHKKRNLVFFYAASGLAVLAKGPVGLALPAMIIGLYLVVERKLSFIKQMHIGWGILIFLAIASPWYILISLKDPDYAAYFFIKQNLGSFLSSDTQHPEPFYYYIPVLFGGFFPWSCFLPLAFIYAIRNRLETVRKGTAFLVIWFSVVFIFFSMANSKLATYILPLFPAASLLIALLWHELLSAPPPGIRKAFLVSFLPVVMIFSGAMIYLWASPPVEIEYESGIKLNQINLLALLLLAAVFLALFFLLAKKDSAFFTAMVGMMVTALICFLLLLAPSLAPYRSTKKLAQKYDQLTPPNEKLVFYRRIRESALFYANRKARVLKTNEQLEEHLASQKRVFCFISQKRLSDLKSIPYVIDQEGDNLLISNKKAP